MIKAFIFKVIRIIFIRIPKLLEPEGENDLLIDEDTMDDQKSDAEKNEMSVDSADEDDESDEDSDVDDEEMMHKNDASLDKALKKFNFLKNKETDDEEEDESS